MIVFFLMPFGVGCRVFHESILSVSLTNSNRGALLFREKQLGRENDIMTFSLSLILKKKTVWAFDFPLFSKRPFPCVYLSQLQSLKAISWSAGSPNDATGC